MNKEEFFKLYGNKIFAFQVKMGIWKPVAMAGEDNNPQLVIIFKDDNSLAFPGSISFYPDERNWQFDEELQQIVFMDESNTNEVSRYALPTEENRHYFILTKVGNENNRYLCYKDIDFTRSVQVDNLLPSRRVIFMPESADVAVRSQMKDYAREYCCQVKWLKSDLENSWSFLDKAWHKIIDTPSLEQVCVIIAGLPSLDKQVWYDKLAMYLDENDINFISGSRTEVIIVLSQLLIIHDHQLLAEDKIQSPFELGKFGFSYSI
ncbi:hypothetical protein OZX69_03615 [Lactobacillus sp. ESL0731]|uniref:hypothetical protein n=1 Tax=unclassified Lactobacillus TaxID=2620435 RepID=UPI0023F9CAC6|nr:MULTISPECIES: hypothetical protein [unclassified Lactobacillus]WEV51797.1 hypothetical protein OZX63_03615 [Lactobacillus sp. ESL0700]WEV62926.1 hypothetical protein OZX69_03615 [Lactobacillus sp. ESL0731]